jgi:carboxylesterase
VTAPIIPGSEPWSAQGGSGGVLVLHGFTGDPQSMRPLAEALAAAGLTVELPLLPGHGTVVEDMLPTRWEDWSGAAEAEFQSLAARCDRLAVVGLSMGGTIACWLAERHPHLAGLALVNPFVEPPDPEVRAVVRAMLDGGTSVTEGIGSDIKKAGVTESSYSGTPLAPLLSLFDGIDVVRPALGQIRCPVLLCSSREDHVVDPVSGDVVAVEVAGPLERIHLENSYHVATLDNDAALIEQRVVGFALEVLDGVGPSSS